MDESYLKVRGSNPCGIILLLGLFSIKYVPIVRKQHKLFYRTSPLITVRGRQIICVVVKMNETWRNCYCYKKRLDRGRRPSSSSVNRRLNLNRRLHRHRAHSSPRARASSNAREWTLEEVAC